MAGAVLAWALGLASCLAAAALCFLARRRTRATLSRSSGKRGLRVILVGDSFPPKVDGVSTRTNKAAQYLPALGHQCMIMTSIRRCDAALHGVPVTTLPGVHPPQYAQHSLTLPSLRMVTALLAFRPDVVHLVDETVITGVMAIMCWGLGIPTVFSHHTRIDLIAERYAPALTAFNAHRALMRLLQWAVAGRSAVHLVVGQDMMGQLTGAGCTNLRTWPVGTDTDLFNPGATSHHLRGELTASAGVPGHARIVLYVGRVAPEKSLHLLPAVVAQCNASAPGTSPVLFVVVGDGPFLPALKRACHGKPVAFLGEVPHGPRLAAAYATADAFYSPSCFETLGQVYLESMASGTPVVAAAAAGALEVIEHGVTGFLAAPDDVEDAVRCITAACELKRAACAVPSSSSSSSSSSYRGHARTLGSVSSCGSADADVGQRFGLNSSTTSGHSSSTDTASDNSAWEIDADLDSAGRSTDNDSDSGSDLTLWSDSNDDSGAVDAKPQHSLSCGLGRSDLSHTVSSSSGGRLYVAETNARCLEGKQPSLYQGHQCHVHDLLQRARRSAETRSWRESILVASQAYYDAAGIVERR